LTLDGMMPSPSIKARQRVWSTTAYILSMGSIAACSLSGEIPMLDAIFALSSFMLYSSRSTMPASLAFWAKISAYSGS